MYFNTKSYLKSTRNHTAKHALSVHVDKQALRFILRRFQFDSQLGSEEKQLGHKIDNELWINLRFSSNFSRRNKLHIPL